MEQTRIYLADDHELIRRGVRSLVESTSDLTVVGESGNATTALTDILVMLPDIVVLDVRIGEASGLELVRQVHAIAPQIKALVLTDNDDAGVIESAMFAGTKGYVLKRIEGQALVSGIRVVAGGHSMIDPTVAARVLEQMDQQRRSVDVVRDLTPQQRRIFFLIAEGLTNRQIGERLFLAEKTVKNHVTGLLSRLGLEHRTQAALLAARMTEQGTDMPTPTTRASA